MPKNVDKNKSSSNKLTNFSKTLKEMPFGKKVYSFLWTITLTLIAVLIGLFVGLKDEYANKTSQIEVVDQKNVKENNVDKTNYLIQAKNNYSWDIKTGKYKIQKNHFYPLKDIDEMMVKDPNLNYSLFNLDSFSTTGHKEQFYVTATKNKLTKGQASAESIYNTGATDFSLQEIVQALVLYVNSITATGNLTIPKNPKSSIFEDSDKGKALSKQDVILRIGAAKKLETSDVKAIMQDLNITEKTVKPKTEIPVVGHDLSKDISDYVLPAVKLNDYKFNDKLFDVKETLTSDSKTANNVTAAMGGIFLISITVSILTTVIYSIKYKKQGGAK